MMVMRNRENEEEEEAKDNPQLEREEIE